MWGVAWADQRKTRICWLAERGETQSSARP